MDKSEEIYNYLQEKNTVINKLKKEDKDFNKDRSELNFLFCKLKTLIPQSDIDLLFRYEELSEKEHSKELKATFKEGFKLGASFQ